MESARHMRSDITPWTIRGMGLALGVLIVLGLVALGIAAANVLLLLFIAILLASALEPMVGWIRGHLPLGRGATIIVVYVSFFVVMVGLAFVVFPAAFEQAEKIIAPLPPFFREAKDWAADLRPAAMSRSVTALIDSAADVLKPPAPPDPSAVVEVGAAAVEATISFVTLLVIVFFWLVEHARLQRYSLAFLPLERRAGARDAWNEIETRLGMWVRGQLLLMASVGLATGTAYWALGVPAWLVLAVIAAIMEGIPIIGPALGAVPAVLAAATVSPQLALVVAGVAVVIQLVENNVLVPVIMRNTIGLSPLVVTVTLLIGGAVGGIVGALIAVPVAAAIEVVLER